VVLNTLKNLGPNAKPDFLIHHVYPEWTDGNNPAGSSDNDTGLMLSTANWISDAADLRQQISDYYGSSGTNIELVITENNADSGAQGRQSTSLVNGLYYADSLGQVLNTEFKGFVWWDFRNGTDTSGYFGTNVYGWRNYGDLGVVNGVSTRHPTFYAAKLMQWFARPGDKILNVSSDYPWLAAYGCRRANGSVALLFINKWNFTNLTAQISLNGFTPNAPAVVRFYGIPNDEATRTNAPYVYQDITTNSISNASGSFTYTFPTYSMTVISLTPPAPGLVLAPPAPAGTVVMQIQGQPNVPYVVESSPDLLSWSAVSTNKLVGYSLNITNPITAGTPQQFWRASWQP
jgi:alpha-L-arabinofuranosidase